MVKREWSDSDSEDCSTRKKIYISPVKVEKWTDDEIKRVLELKKAGVTYRKMTDEFPGRTKKALERVYQRRCQEMEESFTPEKDAELREEVKRMFEEFENYQKRMWASIAGKIGMSVPGCKKRAEELNL